MQDAGSQDPPEGGEFVSAAVHALRVPALGFGDYRRMQVAMLHAIAAPHRSWRRNLAGAAAGVVVGESGLLWRNSSRTLLAPWPRITGMSRPEGMVFLFADRISAFWLPEAAVAAQPAARRWKPFCAGTFRRSEPPPSARQGDG